MVLDNLILNFGLMGALLVAPCLVLMSYWYRRQLPRTLMVWKKSELVLITITFSVLSLVLFIVGLSSFFTHYGYLDSTQIDATVRQHFFTLGVFCFLLNISTFFLYLAIRILLVQVISEQGIVVNDRYLRIPDFRNVVKWHEVTDYYIKSDYPNVIFTLIVQRQPLKFERLTLRVPVYNRDEFEELLEDRMYSAYALKARSEIGRPNFSEN